ncbi:hypothetical protein CY34DRAFT_15904 [Suillus luteus UH-Slu-Lm8-n1]|uniref:Uncharacterized protein n=1 Tax=Suillus luteus UH-Slu-Lm8-n1 TaxID=930992 RepID=A0A0D0A6D2_9AGAM|nr:hypothetical protein CY34DRAFT_15904 [Suillus luteus UH-Slu-Lm8-n1]
MTSQSPDHKERIHILTQEFESPERICRYFATIDFPNFDRAARHQRWLHLFGRDDLVATSSSSEDASAPTARDRDAWTFIWEIEKISWYELNGADIVDFMNLARSLARGHSPTPQHVKASLKEWGARLSVRRKVVLDTPALHSREDKDNCCFRLLDYTRLI